MENESEFSGLPSLQIVEMQMRRRAVLISVPSELLPALGRLEETRRHYIEAGEIYYQYIYQNRGDEVSRRSTERLDDLLYWVFRDVTFEMATTRSAHEIAHGTDIRQPIYRIQKELMASLKPSWADRLAAEIEEVLTRNPFKLKGTGVRKLSLRNTSPPLAKPTEETLGTTLDS